MAKRKERDVGNVVNRFFGTPDNTQETQPEETKTVEESFEDNESVHSVDKVEETQSDDTLSTEWTDTATTDTICPLDGQTEDCPPSGQSDTPLPTEPIESTETETRSETKASIPTLQIDEIKTVNTESNGNKLVNISKDGVVVEKSDLVYEEGRIYYGKPEIFTAYPNKKLRLPLRTGEKRARLKESIMTNGILDAVICVIKDGMLCVLAGHNRIDIGDEIIKEGNTDFLIPFTVRYNLTQAEEELIVIDTNLTPRQIDEYKPSELAYILKVKNENEKYTMYAKKTNNNSNNTDEVTLSTGWTNDTTTTVRPLSGQSTTKGTRWTDNCGFKLGKSMIAKYIKLNDLIDEFLYGMVDENLLQISIAYEIAFISKDNQIKLYDYIRRYGIKLSSQTAKVLKSNKDKEFTDVFLDTVFNVLSTKRNSKVVSKSYGEIVRKYFPNSLDDDAEKIIEQALMMYSKSVRG